MKRIRVIFFATICALFGMFVAKETFAATLSLDPVDEQYAIGETFIAELRLIGEGEVINAVEAALTYPADRLEALNVSTGGSFLTLWALGPTVDSTTGRITLAGGIPNGSYVVDGKVASVSFRTKAAGVATVGFDASGTSVRRNDGRGTPAPLTLKPSAYRIESRSIFPITSPTHPEETIWYSRNDATFQWNATGGTQYSYILSSDSKDKPPQERMSPVGEVTVKDIGNGISFFILYSRDDTEGWRFAGRRRVQIDSEPPRPIEAKIAHDTTLYDGKFFLIFSTTDRVSGVDHFDIQEGTRAARNVASPYVLEDQSRSTQLTVTAYDRAGNATVLVLNETGTIVTGGTTASLLVGKIALVCALILLLLLGFYRLNSSNRRE